MKKTDKIWTNRMSLTLSRVIVWVLAVIFAASVVYTSLSLIISKWESVGLVWDFGFLVFEFGLDPIAFYTAFYLCAIFAFTALFYLNRLLKNIAADRIFIEENVKILRILSWCCYLVGIVMAIYSFEAYPFVIIAAAAAFFGLIIRVLKNVFAKAVEIKEENDATI